LGRTYRKPNAKAPAKTYSIFGNDAGPKGNPVLLKKAQRCLGPDCKQDDVYEIAVIYNSHRLAAAAAPRPNIPRERLAAVAKKADELRELISGLGDIERVLYELAGQIKEVPRGLYKQAKAEWLPVSSAVSRPVSESKWIAQLRGLADLSREVLAVYDRKFGPDVGGRTNVHKKLFQSPEEVLVKHAWYLFERYKPGQATTTEGGPFHRFVQQIYEYATGKGADEDGAPTLSTKIKQMLKPLRDYQHNVLLLKQAEELSAKMLSKLASTATVEELNASMQELREAVGKIDPGASQALKNAAKRKKDRC
jgi:hypothetical protein